LGFTPGLATRLLGITRFSFIGVFLIASLFNPRHPLSTILLCILVWDVDEQISNQSNLGRRILGAHFLTFFHSCPNVNSGADHANIASNALNTYTLGEHIGREWGIGRVLRWEYMVDPQVIARGVDNMHVRRFSVVRGPDPQFSQDLFPYRRSFVDQLFVRPQFVSGNKRAGPRVIMDFTC